MIDVSVVITAIILVALLVLMRARPTQAAESSSTYILVLTTVGVLIATTSWFLWGKSLIAPATPKRFSGDLVVLQRNGLAQWCWEVDNAAGGATDTVQWTAYLAVSGPDGEPTCDGPGISTQVFDGNALELVIIATGDARPAPSGDDEWSHVASRNGETASFRRITLTAAEPLRQGRIEFRRPLASPYGSRTLHSGPSLGLLLPSSLAWSNTVSTGEDRSGTLPVYSFSKAWGLGSGWSISAPLRRAYVPALPTTDLEELVQVSPSESWDADSRGWYSEDPIDSPTLIVVDSFKESQRAGEILLFGLVFGVAVSFIGLGVELLLRKAFSHRPGGRVASDSNAVRP